MNKNHIGQSFGSFLKEENVEISEEEIKKTLDLMFDKLCTKEGMKRCEPFIKIEESEEEIKKNSLIYGFTCLDEKGKIIPNYKIFQIDNKLIINESEDEK